MAGRIPPTALIREKDYLIHPPSVPAHDGRTFTLSSSDAQGSSQSRSRGSAAAGAAVPQQARRNSNTPYPLPQDGLRSPTRSRFAPPAPPAQATGIGPDRNSRVHRRASQTQDENFPPGTRRPKWDGPANHDLVRVGIFQSPTSTGSHAVRFFAKGSTEPGVPISSLACPRPVLVTGNWLFDGVADRELNIDLAWPGYAFTAKRRLNTTVIKNTQAPYSAYNVLAEMLADYVLEFIRQIELHPVQPGYEHMKVNRKGGPGVIDARQIVIGGLHHVESSKWEIQLWIPRRR